MLNHIDYQNEEASIRRLFDNISTTIIFISQALSHLEAYHFTEFSPEEELQLKNEIFTFHAMTFQFFLVIQFCKLFEGSRKKTEGDSSLSKLNNILNDKYPGMFKSHSKNIQLIKEIKKSKTYQHFKELRNKTYAHSEDHPLNRPLKFLYLKKGELLQFKDDFIKAIDVLKNCTGLYGVGITFHHFYNSSSPKVFLQQYFRTKAFWKKQFKA